MPESENERVVVVGAGLGGALMATALARAGYGVDLYERRSDPRAGHAPAGRSINLAISTRGLHALAQVGLERDVLDAAVQMPGRMIHSPTGDVTYQPYSKSRTDALNSVSRLGLNILLINAAERCDNLRLFFDHKCLGADLDSGIAEFTNGTTGKPVRAPARFIVGADGAFSAIRARMQRTDRFDYSQGYLEHGYKELSIPPGPGGAFRMEKNALHIWPRQRFMMIALPNADGSFTCTLFWPFEGPVCFDRLKTDDDVLRFFNEHFPDVVPLMPTLVEDYRNNAVSSLCTVRCGPWYHRDKVVLLGDACHAVVPFYGQGAIAAFGDCTELSACLAEFGPDVGRAFATYHERRKRHVDVLADLAIGNFVEMRDHTGSRLFLLKKKGEKLMHTLLPGWYVPLYSMIQFTRIPYADALDRARRQHRIIRNVAAIVLTAALVFAVWLFAR